MVMALIANMAAAIENVPPSSPVTTILPPRASTPVAELQRAIGADEVAGRQHAAGRRHDRPPRLRVGWVVGRGRAGRERRVAFLRIDVGDDRRLAKQGARDGKPHHADPAEADEQHRAAVGPLAEMLQRAVGGQARAHQRARESRRKAVHSQ